MKATQRIFLAGWAVLCLLSYLLGTAGAAQAASTTPNVVVLSWNGAVTPILVDYIQRGLSVAENRQAELVILQLNTPGGGIESMNKAVTAIRASSVPVVVYVAPRNAWAASAGTIITLSGHLAAMAPETTIGAASPVGSGGADIALTEQAKVKEMLKASVRTLAKDRGAAAIQAAEQTIDQARALTAQEALQVGLVDLQADDISDLLRQLDGRSLQFNGETRTLHTAGATLAKVPNSLVEQALQLMTDPNLVFLLLSIGVQALLIELSSPGGWVAGFVGVVSLLLAFYGLGLLTVNYVGALFILVAFILFVLDIKAPTHGALSVVGTGTFIFGALVLFNSIQIPGISQPVPVEGPVLSIPLVIGTGLVMGLSFFAIVRLALRAQRGPVLTGKQILIGRVGVVRMELHPRGQVQVGGEMWSAQLEEGELTPLSVGTRVEVVRIEGLRIIVRKSP